MAGPALWAFISDTIFSKIYPSIIWTVIIIDQKVSLLSQTAPLTAPDNGIRGFSANSN